MRNEQRVLLTNTIMRDTQPVAAPTRMRTIDMVAIAQAYAALLPQLFSVECWGGATIGAALRFLPAASLMGTPEK
jgi:pyruvate carboxylase